MSECEPDIVAGGNAAIAKPEAESDKKALVPTYGLIKFTDMSEEAKVEIIDLITGAAERHVTDYLSASKSIREGMDRMYGAGWHVIVGEQFGFDVSYQTRHILYMFFGGNLGILVWKCS